MRPVVWGMAQMEQRLPCKHGDLYLIASAHVNGTWSAAGISVISAQGRRRQEDPWDPVPSWSTPVSEP